MKLDQDWNYVCGTGHWEAFRKLNFDMMLIREAAQNWAKALDGVKLPWLCWNVDHDWCLVQQKLVAEVGWTPVVGFDPRVGPPPLIDNAICIDFKESLGLPTMWFHF